MPVSKFILRPAAKGDDDIMAQTHRLIDKVLPSSPQDGQNPSAAWPQNSALSS
jgi:hypothetical protein